MIYRITTPVILLFSVIANGAVVPFDLSNAYNYDAVATQLELTANPGGIAPGLGDHNVRRQPSWADRTTYVNQGSITDNGIGLPDDGVINGASFNYQLGAYDNGTDGTVKQNNTLALDTGNTGGTVTLVVNLEPGDQAQYNSFNMLFTSMRQNRGPWRTYVEAGYSDATSAIVVDTGVFTDGSTGSAAINPGGTFGGAEADGNGGFTNLTDNYVFTNQAPNTGNGIGHSLAYGMDRRMGGDSTNISTGTAAMWEFDAGIPLDPTKTLTSLTLSFTAPSNNINRDGGLFVYAISGDTVPEPAAVFTAIGILAGVLFIKRRRR